MRKELRPSKDWNVRLLQILLVDHILDALASMSSDLLGFCIRQLLRWLDGEVLSIDFLLEFFPLFSALS